MLILPATLPLHCVLQEIVLFTFMLSIAIVFIFIFGDWRVSLIMLGVAPLLVGLNVMYSRLQVCTSVPAEFARPEHRLVLRH